MIKVLQTWDEIGQAIVTFQRSGLPLHETVQKNWDHFLLYNILANKNRNIKILDLGCGNGLTLKFFLALGFLNIYGIDLKINLNLRIRRICKSLLSGLFKSPFYLYQGDIHKTMFKNEFFDFINCLSTIEHSINIKLLLNEVHRILKPNGLLFITTDYWEEKINVDKSDNIFGLPWEIFSKKEIFEVIDYAKEIGFELTENLQFPLCSNKIVSWNNYDYTFIALLLKKSG